MAAAWAVDFIIFNNTRTSSWFGPNATSSSDLVRFISVGWLWILMLSLYQCWPERKDMDLNSIKVWWVSFSFLHSLQTSHVVWCASVTPQRLWEAALIMKVFWCPRSVSVCVCFSTPNRGAGTWSICSLKASTALNCFFRAASVSSRHLETGKTTKSPHHWGRGSTPEKEQPLYVLPFFVLKTCT